MADENAKANLNYVYQRKNRDKVNRIVRQLSSAPQSLRCYLRPYRTSGTSPDLPAFDSRGQVFAFDPKMDEVHVAELVSQATDKTTCWGDGRLNIHRASDQTLIAVCELASSRRVAEKLNRMRHEEPQESAANLARRLALRQTQEQRLLDALVDQSNCFSLWQRVTTTDRVFCRLSVAESDDMGSYTVSNFVW